MTVVFYYLVKVPYNAGDKSPLPPPPAQRFSLFSRETAFAVWNKLFPFSPTEWLFRFLRHFIQEVMSRRLGRPWRLSETLWLCQPRRRRLIPQHYPREPGLAPGTRRPCQPSPRGRRRKAPGPAHADSAASARPPQPLPPRRSAAVWSPLTAPRPADAASSCASTLPYQKRGGASAFIANQRQPRPRRAGPPCGQEEADWMTAAPGRGVRGPRPPLFSAAGRQPRPRPDR